MADDYVSKTLLLREGLLNRRRYEDIALDQFLYDISGRNSRWGWFVGAKNDLIQQIWDRRFHDQIDWQQLVSSGENAQAQRALSLLDDIATDYQQALEQRGMLDFALLEQQLLTQLQQDQPTEFLSQIRVILVDEYQDTNLLQEQIYLEIARHCQGAITVVGDDDQSLYRFRGATVELFSNFATRYQQRFGQRPRPRILTDQLPLHTKYR
jgi:DNA helicase-2/ATP-dependent DNA helicase PcrA